MDPLYEEEIMAEEAPKSIFEPVTNVLHLLASYGWYIVAVVVVGLYGIHKLKPAYKRWKEAQEDAEYHKDPDKALARMEAVQRAREKQQEMLLEASRRAAEQQKEREEKKRQEALERLEKYGTAAGGRKLGTPNDDGYLPLSGGGASTSTYRPPKKSKCGGGGCGR